MRRRVRKIKKLLMFGPAILGVVSIVLCILVLLAIGRQREDTIKTQEELAKISKSQNNLLSREDELETKVEALNEAAAVVAESEQSEEAFGEDDGLGESERKEWPKRVYITFDDGPSSYTAKILDILKEYGVHANFFCVGTQNGELRKMYKRILDEGHVLGMHSYSHKYSEIYSSPQAFTTDLDKITQLLYDETGVTPKYYRFPAGSRNDVSDIDMSTLYPILEARGIKYFDWNVASGDATNPMLPTEKILENVLGHVADYEETMILFHDLGNKHSTVEALPSIIEALLEEEIPIVLIDDTTTQIKQNTKQ